MALQLGWFLDAGAMSVRADGTLAVDPARMHEAVVSLTREILAVQARGDRAAATALLARLGTVRPDVKRILDRLGAVPVDIAPTFPAAEALLAGER
jgi:hypothetical protein